MQNTAENTAAGFDPTAQNDSEQQTYPVTVDGETMELTLDQLIAAAEQGLSQNNAAARRDNAIQGEPDGQVYGRFLEAYPNIRPGEIPEEVWEEANRTGDLLGAYRIYEIAQLKQEIEDLKKNQENRSMDVGSARSDGESKITDPIILALMGRG